MAVPETLFEERQAMNDHEAIRRLLTEYCIGADTNDTERAVACFSDDTVVQGPFGSFEGKEAWRAFRQSAGGASSKYRHVSANAAIDVDGDRATARSAARPAAS